MILSESDLKITFIAFLTANCRQQSKLFEKMIPTFNHLALFVFREMSISDKEIRNDIMQSVYIKLATKKFNEDKIKNSSNFSGYIRVIVKNKVRDYQKITLRYEVRKMLVCESYSWEQNTERMKTTEKMKTIISESNTKVLIEKLIETMSKIKFSFLNIAIKEELDNRIGEDKVDKIMQAHE